MLAGPVIEIFFSLMLLCCGSNNLAMMSLYSLMPHITPVGSDILQPKHFYAVAAVLQAMTQDANEKNMPAEPCIKLLC